MQNDEKQKLIRDIEHFESQKDTLPPFKAENILTAILLPLLNEDGYDLNPTNSHSDDGFDFLAVKHNKTLGIDYKHFKEKKAGIQNISHQLAVALISNFDKIILIANSGFTNSAREFVSKIDPISVELIDLSYLTEWAAKIEANYDQTEISQVLRTFTQKIIELIHKNPRVLDEVEWRDLERVIAEVFRGIGFVVELTPFLKDGGKDIILECSPNSASKHYC